MAVRPVVVTALLACCLFSIVAARRSSLSAAEDKHYCPNQNMQLSVWLDTQTDQKQNVLPNKATSLDSFLQELKTVLDQRMLPERAINYLFSDASPFHPTCAGDWMEFGVFHGDTINYAAKARQATCGDTCPPIFGFDTFTGLPEAWVRDDKQTAEAGSFSTEGKFPKVEHNVQLIQGKFGDMLPLFEGQHNQHSGNQTLSFLHIDCNLHSSTMDVLINLNGRIKRGTVIIFDELVNYNKYREGEVKALWEWLHETGAKLATLGMLGPLEGKDFAMDIDINEPSGEHPWHQQSVAFVVVEAPRPLRIVRPKAADPARARPQDATERDVVTMAADEMEGDKEMGALGHLQNSKRVPVEKEQIEPDGAAYQQTPAKAGHRTSRGTRDRRRAEATDPATRESIIPLKELDVDPEGDTPQDSKTGLEPIKDKEVPADAAENLDTKKSSLDNFLSTLDAEGLDTLSTSS